jgi:hypothetical protein
MLVGGGCPATVALPRLSGTNDRVGRCRMLWCVENHVFDALGSRTQCGRMAEIASYPARVPWITAVDVTKMESTRRPREGISIQGGPMGRRTCEAGAKLGGCGAEDEQSRPPRRKLLVGECVGSWASIRHIHLAVRCADESLRRGGIEGGIQMRARHRGEFYHPGGARGGLPSKV